MYPSSCLFQFQYRSQNQLVAVTVILFERKQENGYFNHLISLISSIFSESQDSSLIYVIVVVLIKKTIFASNPSSWEQKTLNRAVSKYIISSVSKGNF